MILLEGRSENSKFQNNFSKYNSIAFYRSLGMRNQVETQKKLSQGDFNSATFYALFSLMGGGGGGLRTISFKINLLQIQLYHILSIAWICNQVETEKERSQFSSILQNSMHCLAREGSRNNSFQNNFLQIQFFHVLFVPWDAQ